MHKCVTLPLLRVLLAGCGKNEPIPSRPGGAALPSIQPRAGGDMILLPGCSFTMGDRGGREDETPHVVSVSAFYLDKVPVTQELYSKVMGVNPSKRKDPKC